MRLQLVLHKQTEVWIRDLQCEYNVLVPAQSPNPAPELSEAWQRRCYSFIIDLVGCRLNSRFSGFPVLGIQWQSMESKALNAAYRLSGARKGVLVKHVIPLVDAQQKLKRGDIIMKFDGVQIASDGTVPFRFDPMQIWSRPCREAYEDKSARDWSNGQRSCRCSLGHLAISCMDCYLAVLGWLKLRCREGERVTLSYLVSQKIAGAMANLSIFRDGQDMEVDIKLSEPIKLVPRHIGNQRPSYFIVAG